MALDLLATSPTHSGIPTDQPSTPHLSLPFEIVLLIAEHLDLADLKSFLQVSRCYSQLLTPVFNRFALQPRYRVTAFYWAVATGNRDLMALLIEKGKNFIVKKNDRHKTTILGAPEESLLPGIFNEVLNEGGRIIVHDTFDFCTPLHDAARHGRNYILRLLLQMGADVNITDIRGWAPLHHATWEGNKSAIRLLLANGSNPDIQDSHGMTPLHLAISQGDNIIALLLLAAGANASLEDMRGWTAIEMRSDDTMLPMILGSLRPDYKSSLGQTVLHLAVMVEDIEMAIQFLAKGVDINARDISRSTALHDAATAGHIELVKLLLAKGAEVNTQDIGGFTPLHVSLFNWPKNIASVAMILLDKGAKIEIRDYDGCSIFDNLVVAFETESDRLLFEYLLEKTDINFRTKNGRRSSLHLAAESGRETCVLALLNKGANINECDELGWTALHFAAAEQTGESKIRLLLDKGANVSDKTKDGKTAIDIALGTGNLTASLLEAVDNIDFRTIYEKQTLLHLSVKLLDVRLAKAFIDKGVNINAKDTRGKTPLHYAVFGPDWDMVRLLMGRGADNTIEDQNGLTPLHELMQLVKGGRCPGEYVLLLGRGLNLCAKDSDGNTLLDLAIKHQHNDAARVLQEMQVSETDGVLCNRFKRRERST